MSLINCPECRKSVSDAAAACTHCGLPLSPETVAVQKARKQNAEQIVAAVGVVLGGVLMLFCSGVATPSTGSQPSAHSSTTFDWSTTGNGRSGPITRAQFVVKERLKAPATASFPWSFDEYFVRDLGGGRWWVRGYVDSQNGFGAQVRTSWTVTWKNSGESAVVENVEFD